MVKRLRLGDKVRIKDGNRVGHITAVMNLRDLVISLPEDRAILLMARVKAHYGSEYRSYQEVLVEDERRRILRWFHVHELTVEEQT